MLARFGRAAYGCFVPQAGSWLNSCFHSALSSVLFGKSGVSSSPPPALLWVGCSSPSLSPSSRIQPLHRAMHPWHGWDHGVGLAQLPPFSPSRVPRPAPTIPSIPCAKASSDLCSPLLTDVPGLALGRPRPLCPAAELHEHFCQLVWLYAADPLADEARPCPL